jgi:hypothetical protein
MPPLPPPALGIGQATGALGVFLAWRDGPADTPRHQAVAWGVRWQGTAGPLAVTACAREGALAEPPALWSRADAGLARRAWGAAGGPGPADGAALVAEDPGGVRAPGEGRPAVLGPAHADRPGLRQGRWARLRGLATPARWRRPHERGGVHRGWQADAQGAADAHHGGALAVVAPWPQRGGAPAPASATPQANGTPPARACAPRARALGVCTVSAVGTGPVVRRARAVTPTSGRARGAGRGQGRGARLGGAAAPAGARTTPWPWATVPSVPA